MKCKYCNSENLILEKRSKDDKHILDAQQVALICGDCGKYIKWCPKDERKFYWQNTSKENGTLNKIEYFDKLMTEYNCQDTYELVKAIEQQLAEKDKEIKKLKEDKDWYSMWHKKFQKEIEDLKTELETYRPTHLKGNGQCQCAICKQINWTDWCIKYDGKTYCDGCFKQVETRDDKLRKQVCEKIRKSFDEHRKILHSNYDECIFSMDEIIESLDQIEKGE